MKGFLKLPESGCYQIANCVIAAGAVRGGDRLFVDGGKVSGAHDGPVIDAGGAMVLPGFVDMHTHLDKGHIWPRAPNPDGSFGAALEAVHRDRETNWHAADVTRRMDFALRCAYAHGTRAIRTHLDSAPPQHRISWPAFDAIRSSWRDRIELQAVTIFSIESVDKSAEFTGIADMAARYGGALGCVTYPVADIDDRLERFFSAASERGMSVDLHVDETRDPGSATLRSIAEAAIRTGFEGGIVAGHCCSLARQEPGQVDATLDLVAEAGIDIVSLPMCNLYLQDRFAGRTPRWRGVTLVHEMRCRGIRVAFASDNTRDPFYAYGDLDMVEVMREATRICHLDHTDPDWHDAFSAGPAGICGFSPDSLRPGDRADFVLFNARDWSELLPRPQSDRVVVRDGLAIDRTLPDYRELDDLMEAV
ncbi:MAG: cytosine deaminase [Rhodobacteraceae bacterium]|nr:cytosine deaminase [Paracoccaceae bacterium]